MVVAEKISTNKKRALAQSPVGRKRSAKLHEDEFQCSICLSLLLDPVVAPCGHDACYACLKKWLSSKAADVGPNGNFQQPACPICREPLPPKLKVCLRYSTLLEEKFPSQLEDRRNEQLQLLEYAAELEKQMAQDSIPNGAAQHAMPGAQYQQEQQQQQHLSAIARLSMSPHGEVIARVYPVRTTPVNHAGMERMTPIEGAVPVQSAMYPSALQATLVAPTGSLFTFLLLGNSPSPQQQFQQQLMLAELVAGAPMYPQGFVERDASNNLAMRAAAFVSTVVLACPVSGLGDEVFGTLARRPEFEVGR